MLAFREPVPTMEGEYETLELEVRRYISPECSCKVEDMVNTVPHVIDSTFDPVNNILRVKVHKGMISAKEIIDTLKQCSVECETRSTAHEKAHMEHEANFHVSSHLPYRNSDSIRENR